MLFIKTLDKMLKIDLILKIMNWIDHCLNKNLKKDIGLMKHKLDGKIMTKFVGLRARAYSYLIDDGSGDKKVKGTKECVIKRKLKFQKIIKTV